MNRNTVPRTPQWNHSLPSSTNPNQGDDGLLLWLRPDWTLPSSVSPHGLHMGQVIPGYKRSVPCGLTPKVVYFASNPTLPVTLNGIQVEALINTGCGQTLVTKMSQRFFYV